MLNEKYDIRGVTKMDYNELGKLILDNVGGPDNIVSISHCVTRVRFILKDESRANDNVIKNINGVLQLVKQGGQYQVVIGPNVAKVYQAIVKFGNLTNNVIGKNALAETQSQDKKNEGWFTKGLGLVASIFTPILDLLCGAGMIKAVLSILSVCHLVSPTSGTYMILNSLGDSIFYFFPIVIGWSAAKRFRIPESYGIILGSILIYPTIVAAAGAKNLHTIFDGTIFAMKYADKFLGIPIALQNYTSSVVPAIILIWVSGYIYRFFEKYIPDVIKMVFVPFLTIMVAGIVGLLVIGPVAMILQNLLSGLVLWLVGISRGLTGFFLGAFWSLLVMFGLHWAVIPFFAIDIAKYGYDVINPLIFSGALAVLGSSIGIAIRTKNSNTRSMSIAAAISSFFGVNEPALYGILVPRKWIMITSFIGAGIGGAIAGFANSKLYSFGANGILGLPCFINPKGIDAGFIWLCISGVVAFAFAMISALVIGDRKGSFAVISEKANEKQKNNKVVKNVAIYSPVKGIAVDLTSVKDKVFSKLTMGDGIAIVPNEGKIYSPFDGIIRVMYNTGHAIGLHSNDGEEVLIHIGIDTINLKGKYFNSHVVQGMKVKKGDLLVEFDLDQIMAAGYDSTVMVIVTKTDNLKKVTPEVAGPVDNSKQVLKVELG